MRKKLKDKNYSTKPIRQNYKKVISSRKNNNSKKKYFAMGKVCVTIRKSVLL